jgi:hypothetical protein
MARISGKRDHLAFNDPREEYVFTTQSMAEVIVRWDGKQGHTRASILSRRTREKWDEQKENFARVLDGERAAAFARKVADSDSDELVKAVKRHRQLGLLLQQFALGKQTLIDRKDGRKEMVFEDRGEAIPVSFGDIIRAIKEGVTIERKALGLDDHLEVRG